MVNARLSRRAALRGGAGVLLGGASLGLLPLFGTPDRKQDPASCRTRDLSSSDKRLVVSNWPGYIDEDDGDYTSPDPLDDLQLSKQLCLEYYAKGKLNNLREDRLELLRRYLSQINEIEQAMMPPAPPMMPPMLPGATGEPLAPPMPMAPSE